MQLDLLVELGWGKEKGEGVVVRLGDEGYLARPIELANAVEDLGRGQAGLLEEGPGDRETEAELRALARCPKEPVEGRKVAPVRDPPEDRQVAIDIKIRPSRTQVEVPEPGEPPRLVHVQVEDDLHRRPATSIASR